MITDKETNFVYFSSLIKEDEKYLPFWNRLKPILDENQIRYGFIENTRDIWCRDYMPIQKELNDFVQFEYFPDYLIEPKFIAKLTIPAETKIADVIATKKSKLIVDGGNIIKSKSIAILTDKVYDENSKLDHKTVISTLKKELGVEEIFLIPKAPYEITGHADGMVRFLNETDLLVADYSKESETWKSKMKRALDKTGLNIIIYPAEIVEEKNEYGEYVARGVYINFAQIGEVILLPQFGLKTDKIALEKTKELFSDCKVIPIMANEIAAHGGVLNCITWNIKITKKQELAKSEEARIAEIKERYKARNELAKQVLEQYEPIVAEIIATQTKDVSLIALTLDYLLDFSFDDDILELYRKLGRQLYYIDPQVSGFYANAYFNKWSQKVD